MLKSGGGYAIDLGSLLPGLYSKKYATAVLFVLGLLLLGTALIPLAHAAPTVSTIKVAGTPEGIAYDSANGDLYVASNPNGPQKPGYLQVISDKSDTVVANITIGDNPYGVVYDSGKGEIFVANKNSNTVSVISGSSNSVVATVNVATGPVALAYESLKGEVFVSSLTSASVAVIADSNNTVIGNVALPAGAQPQGLAFDSKTGDVLVADSTGQLYVISYGTFNATNTNDISDAGTEYNQPYGVAYDPGTGEIYVANSGAANVKILSQANYVTVAGPVKVQSFPDGMAYDPAQAEMLVADAQSNSVAIIPDNNQTSGAVTFVNTLGADDYNIAYDSGTGQAFVSNEGAETVTFFTLGPPSASTTSTTSAPPSTTTPTAAQTTKSSTTSSTTSATSTASTTSSSSSTSSSTTLSLTYLGLVAANAAIFLSLGARVLVRKKARAPA